MIAAIAPRPRECIWAACLYGDPWPFDLFIGWEPYIDNAGVGTQPSRDLRCPGRQAAGTAFRIDYAPLPAGFDAHGYPEGDVLACVKLRDDGSVEAVRMLAGTGRARLDSRLVRIIHRQWRFRRDDGAGGGHSWQRVRLNSGYGSGPKAQVGSPPLWGRP